MPRDDTGPWRRMRLWAAAHAIDDMYQGLVPLASRISCLTATTATWRLRVWPWPPRWAVPCRSRLSGCWWTSGGWAGWRPRASAWRASARDCPAWPRPRPGRRGTGLLPRGRGGRDPARRADGRPDRAGPRPATRDRRHGARAGLAETLPEPGHRAGGRRGGGPGDQYPVRGHDQARAGLPPVPARHRHRGHARPRGQHRRPVRSRPRRHRRGPGIAAVFTVLCFVPGLALILGAFLPDPAVPGESTADARSRRAPAGRRETPRSLLPGRSRAR